MYQFYEHLHAVGLHAQQAMSTDDASHNPYAFDILGKSEHVVGAGCARRQYSAY